MEKCNRIPMLLATCTKNAFLLFNHLLLRNYVLLHDPNQDALAGYPSRGSAETADLRAATKYSNSFLQKAGTTKSLNG
jgi:hypothetical protein